MPWFCGKSAFVREEQPHPGVHTEHCAELELRAWLLWAHRKIQERQVQNHNPPGLDWGHEEKLIGAGTVWMCKDQVCQGRQGPLRRASGYLGKERETHTALKTSLTCTETQLLVGDTDSPPLLWPSSVHLLLLLIIIQMVKWRKTIFDNIIINVTITMPSIPERTLT
jgi:hypothetical protein